MNCPYCNKESNYQPNTYYTCTSSVDKCPIYSYSLFQQSNKFEFVKTQIDIEFHNVYGAYLNYEYRECSNKNFIKINIVYYKSSEECYEYEAEEITHSNIKEYINNIENLTYKILENRVLE